MVTISDPGILYESKDHITSLTLAGVTTSLKIPQYVLLVRPQFSHIQEIDFQQSLQGFHRGSCVAPIRGLKITKVALRHIHKDIGKPCCVANRACFRAPFPPRVTFGFVFETLTESVTQLKGIPVLMRVLVESLLVYFLLFSSYLLDLSLPRPAYLLIKGSYFQML